MTKKYSQEVKYSLAFFIFLIAWCIALVLNQSYNWDMAGYIACAIEIDEEDLEKKHERTYAILEQELPPKDYQEITAGNAFKAACAEDAVFFDSMLSFFRIKPVYVYSIYVFYHMGLSMSLATAILPFMALLLLGLVCFHWLKKYLSTLLTFLVAILVFFLAPISEMGRIASPDALSSLIIFLVFYLIIERKEVPLFWVWCLLILAALVRIENVIFATTIALFLLGRLRFGKIGVATIVESGLWIVSFGLLAIVLPFLVGNSLDWFAQYDQFASMKSYWQGGILLINSMRLSQVIPILIIFILLWPLISITKEWKWILCLVAINCLIKIAIFPIFDDRYYAGFYLVVIIFLAQSVRKGEQNYTF